MSSIPENIICKRVEIRDLIILYILIQNASVIILQNQKFKRGRAGLILCIYLFIYFYSLAISRFGRPRHHRLIQSW